MSELGWAREWTAGLRDSDEAPWPLTRRALEEIGVDPRTCAVGEWTPEQIGPLLVVATSAGGALVVELDEHAGLYATEGLETANERFPHARGIHLALAILEEEGRTGIDSLAPPSRRAATSRRTSAGTGVGNGPNSMLNFAPVGSTTLRA